MATQRKYRILIWLVVILAATNLSMGLSFLYHRQQDKKREVAVEERTIEVPAQQRTRFFREQLNLEPQQVLEFRELNRQFNRKAWGIQHHLDDLRVEMVKELSVDSPDMQKLNDISERIGDLHKQLKDETINYYLEMKRNSTKEQQVRLQEIFMSVLQNNEDVQLPQTGRRYRNNRKPLQVQ